VAIRYELRKKNRLSPNRQDALKIDSDKADRERRLHATIWKR
jgi:hypothetical protein